jgi:hypothetical protein
MMLLPFWSAARSAAEAVPEVVTVPARSLPELFGKGAFSRLTTVKKSL